jgi:hypothetical protein
MKAPDIKDLAQVDQKSTFRKKVEEVKAESEKMTKKTFSITENDLDYVNDIALQLGQERGKVVSASEAFRIIIKEHREGKK